MSNGTNASVTSLAWVLVQHRETILSEWIREMSMATRRADLMKASELEKQCDLFMQQVSAKRIV